MCIVLEASRFGKFQQAADENMKPVRDWVYRGNGKVAYAPIQDLKREWDKGGAQIKVAVATQSETQTSVAKPCSKKTS